MPQKPGTQRKKLVQLVESLDPDKPLPWNPILEEVFELIFIGRMPRNEIAKKFGVTPQALCAWLRHPDFQKRLADKRAELEASLLERGTAYVDKASRIIALSEMAEQARLEFEAHPTVVERKQIGVDDEGRPMWQENEYFNRDAHDSFRQAVADIAKELGHRVAKADITAKFDVNERVVFVLPERQEVIDAAPAILSLPERSDDEDPTT